MDCTPTTISSREGFSIDRFDYGVKWDRTLDSGGLIVSKEVAIAISVEMIAQK